MNKTIKKQLLDRVGRLEEYEIGDLFYRLSDDEMLAVNPDAISKEELIKAFEKRVPKILTTLKERVARDKAHRTRDRKAKLDKQILFEEISEGLSKKQREKLRKEFGLQREDE